MDYIRNILIIEEYVINPEDDFISQSKTFILRYRRILGIILLIILITILYSCDTSPQHNQQGGADNNFGVGGLFNNANKTVKTAAQMKKSPPIPSKSGKLSLEEIERRKAAGQSKRDARAKSKASQPYIPLKVHRPKLNAPPPTPTPTSTPTPTPTPNSPPSGLPLPKAGLLSKLDKTGKLKFESAKQTAIGKIKDTSAVKKYSEMRSAGFSKKAIAGRAIYGVGAAAGEKFKEFSGWLYEILFAIAISIAICMVILPSLTFFIVGLICYFLLRRKVASLKSI